MGISNQKAEVLANYLLDNATETQKLMGMSACEAAKRLNESGFNFTADELSAFAEDMETALAKQGEELSETELENVAGGGLVERWIRLYLAGARLAAWIIREIEKERRKRYPIKR